MKVVRKIHLKPTEARFCSSATLVRVKHAFCCWKCSQYTIIRLCKSLCEYNFEPWMLIALMELFAASICVCVCVTRWLIIFFFMFSRWCSTIYVNFFGCCDCSIQRRWVCADRLRGCQKVNGVGTTADNLNRVRLLKAKQAWYGLCRNGDVILTYVCVCYVYQQNSMWPLPRPSSVGCEKYLLYFYFSPVHIMSVVCGLCVLYMCAHYVYLHIVHGDHAR